MSFISNWKQKFIDVSASYDCKVIFSPLIWISTKIEGGEK